MDMEEENQYDVIPGSEDIGEMDFPAPPPPELPQDHSDVQTPASPQDVSIPDEEHEHTPSTTIKQAVEQVALTVGLLGPVGNYGLDTVQLQSTDTQSCVYHADMDSKLSDRDNYPCTTSSGLFPQEAESRAILMDTIEQGKAHAAMLYSWRSCAQAIPVVKSQDHPHRMSIYKQTVDILKPEVHKLHSLLKFMKSSRAIFVEEVKRLSEQREQQHFISDWHLLTIGEALEMIITLDELKNIMASIKNDHSAYKRAFEIACKDEAMKYMQDFQDMSMFLGTHNHSRSALKEALQEISGYEEVLCDIYDVALKIVDTPAYIKHQDKHSLLKVIGLCIFFMDGSSVNFAKLETKRKLHFGKVDKLFKMCETLPLFGDIMIVPFSYIEVMPNYDSGRWPHCSSEETSPQHTFMTKMPAIRVQHTQLVCELALLNPTRLKPAINKNDQIEENASITNSRLYNVALKAAKTISMWTSLVVELVAWKLAHPTDHRNKKCPVDAEEYERATRYNYSSKEKTALGELITLIKSLQNILEHLHVYIRVAVQKHMYYQMQEIVKTHLRDIFRKAFKGKKEQLKGLIFGIQESCADWLDGVRPLDDPALKGKKDSKSGYQPQPISVKPTPPSHTQLYILVSRLQFMVDKSQGKKGLRKDLDSHHIQTIENFLCCVHYWPQMLNYTETLSDCCDLSQLWFREFYLNITKDRIQFPIRMSMPWILTEHVLESSTPSMTESLLYLLDLYNDSAQCALNVFKKQYLYTELEAEVDLCFDQLVFNLSEKLFVYYKRLAGSIILHQKCRTFCRKDGFKIQWPRDMHYKYIMTQKQVLLLGRSINFNKLLTQRLNASMLKSLEVAINSFLCDDLTKIMELEGLLEVNRMAHKLLSEYFALDDFTSMYNEANKCVTSPFGQVQLHVFSELNQDFLQKYCYNSSTDRFVTTVLALSDITIERENKMRVSENYLWGSKFLHKSFTALYTPYLGFVGPQHFSTMVSLLGYQNIALILKELVNIIKSIVLETLSDLGNHNVKQMQLIQINTCYDMLKPFLTELLKSMPKNVKLPRYDYGSIGILQYFQEMLKDIMSYSDLQPKVFQGIREIGNAVLFALYLTQALSQQEITELKHAAPFQNIIPKPYIEKKENMSKEEREKELKARMNDLERKYYYQQVAPIIAKHGNEEQKFTTKHNALLSKEKLCISLGIFGPFLKRVQDLLTDEIWYGDSKDDSDISLMGDELQFHRLWSVLQFIYCMPPRSEHEFTVEQLFGEGLQWGGCTLLTLLGQKQKFENFDFAYYLLKVNRIDKKSDKIKGLDVTKMTDRIRKFQILNMQIFSVLEKFMSRSDQLIQSVERPIVHIAPPAPEGQITTDKEGRPQSILILGSDEADV